ncbi:hypothetical protein BD414DRAFT_557024 [Trametes punicea]|nr:hypothetical protein BD414DRAFT_557024 [Trametes punicea]
MVKMAQRILPSHPGLPNDWAWVCNEDYPPSDVQGPPSTTGELASFPPIGSWEHGPPSQEAPKPQMLDIILSPLPIRGMQQLYPYQDRVVPPTPPMPQPSLPLSQVPYQTTHATVTASHGTVGLPTSPSSMPYLSIPGSYESPNVHLTSQFTSSPSQRDVSSYLGSPGAGSPSTYYSFSQVNSPAMASVSSYHSLSPTTPAMQIDSAFGSFAQAGPSELPSVPYTPPQPSLVTSSASSHLPRIPVPQAVEITSKWRSLWTEHFAVGGVPGVPVREVLRNSVTVDGHGEHVLERTGVRQIRFVLAWPGYKEMGSYISAQDDHGFITRGELVKRICVRLARFMKCLAKDKVQGEHTRWSVGQNGFTTDNLWLLSIGPAHKNIWFAELQVHQ